MRKPFLAGAAVVILTAALAACGSSGEQHGPAAADAPRSAASGPSVAGPATAPAGGAPAGGARSGADASGTDAAPATPAPRGPKVPGAELTPATGTFTEKQKEYLTDRVPRGMDPAAVLQTGQETCDKLDFLVKADRRIAVGAIVTDEVPDAAPAVAHLCAAHQDLVDEAALGYADGTTTGKELRPGTYRSVSPTTACTWRTEGAAGKVLDQGSSTSGQPVRITLPAGARTFTSTGCYAWLPEGDTS
ncbi:hypothetical protein OG233_05945 [Streptomyces sp. NBC_01218]|uniref:hypothetical protein n=1 Tax=Streptomyces sp. NBC_01218 TaxID=2903780 RepID=UPI002E0D9FCC|nr:hypothetical protein OG233_05945 [Streptomyces sp. NBC_01218]